MYAPLVAVLPDVSGTISTSTAGMDVELLAVAGVGIGIGVVVLLLRRGWGLFKSFAR